jgi:CRISPR/Cas system-associated endoribonuclease Cas2
MRKEVAAVVADDLINVRYYDICEACHRRTATMGRAVTTSIKPVYII